ncbi:DNA/RNA non-specific endonuclease, partial [Candidatus Chloroploca sp. Khr17]|uniref:DNA/RNA non-specific endonuclease n=1 Tax=Candidatus Chloroploca sp. Khr17 TaxID=2496869 RepID=UPI00101D69D1
RLTIPANVWKVMLVLPAADGDDRARITPSTPVIALWTPNDATVDGRAWQDYQTTVRCVEERTGLNFFAAVDRAVQDALEGPGCPEPAPAPAPAPPPSPAADQRCFPETGQCIHGPIRAYWERNGGLAIFGFPITTQRAEAVEGQTLQVQWFERDRIEIQATGAVTTGRLGVERLAQLGTPWQPGPGAPAGPGCTTFAVTGHTVCEPFLRSWQTQGGLERFGLPVTGAFTMELEGRPYTVQFFERRRFEAHPELGPSTVLLGLLGREVLEAQPGQPAVPPPPPPAAPPPAAPQPTTAPPPPPAAPQPTPAPAQLPPSFNNCADDPNAAAAPHAPVRIRAIDKRAETVTLQNVSTATVTLDGWIMCSVRGAQRHPIGGVLAPNESRVFPGPPENIWNNSSSDPGSLYDPAGRLVSYWPD